MSLTIKHEQTPIIDEGTFLAVCIKIIDLGTQKMEMQLKSGEKKEVVNKRVRIYWELVNEMIEVNGEEFPRTISKEFTFSLYERSNFYAMIKSWKGSDFTSEELSEFNLSEYLGRNCQLQIIHSTSAQGVKYACVNNVMALPKGTNVAAQKNELLMFDLAVKDSYSVFYKLPAAIQKKISECPEFAETGLEYTEDKDKIPVMPENTKSVPANTITGKIDTIPKDKIETVSDDVLNDLLFGIQMDKR